MRKSFMNIKHFVDSNVRYKANTTSEPISDDLVLVERQFEDLRQLCSDAEKRISTLLQSISTSTLGAYTQNVQASLSNLSQLTQVTSPAQAALAGDQQNSANQNYANNSSVLTSNNDNNVRPHAAGNQLHAPDGGQSSENTKFDITKHHKKLPIVGFLKFLVKSSHKLRQDSLLATTMTHCSHLQAQLTKLYMSFERTIEAQCLKPIQHVLETDVPNIIRLRKSFIKAHNDLESVRARYNGASQKQQQHQLTAHFTSTSYTITQSNAHQANVNKLDSLKKELDDSETRFEQAKDIYAIELYTFVCRETELVELFIKFYQHHAEYQAQASALIQNSLPSLSNTLSTTPRRVVFGTPLSEHLRCTSRNVSVVVELCVHLLYSNALNEEGLFRVPGSSIKIKKLKSAINAWFVTLATHNELSENQDQTEINSRQYKTTTATTQQSTLLAVYSLFKDIVGQRPPNQLTAPVGGEAANHNNQIVSTVKDESAQASAADYSTCDRVSERLVFDVHTVAGLLKLYLRELPEALLGDALYERWADACASHSNTGRGEPIDDLKRVVEQLPKANYDNLRLLTRFLHLLTCHHEQNKMTATNLAITMAPSLIWIPKNRQNQLEPTDNHHQGVDESQTLTMQMSNMGISASLHALIVENLINHGEQLFPGNIDFAIPCLDAEPMSHMSYGRRLRTLANDRPIESNSPTGSSTESTSSFSSNSNMSCSKKSGSIEGLAPECDTAPSPKPVRPTRPQSVHINRELDKRSTKPPVPPAPAIRSHSKQGSDSATLVRRLASRKPPAPPVPVPAPCASLGQSKNTAVAPLEFSGHEVSKDDYAPTKDQQIPQPISLRGTGTLTPNGAGLNVQTRPCVPPPARPHASNQSEKRDKSQSSAISASKLKNECVDVGKSPGSFQDGLDDIKALGMIDDDMSEHTSPVVSLDGVSGDDSSFDNQSWTEYDSDKDKNQLNIDSSGEETTSAPRPKDGSNRSLEPRNSKAIKSSRTESEPTPETKFADNNNLGPLAPPKPPRSTSPKINAASITQSTPL